MGGWDGARPGRRPTQPYAVLPDLGTSPSGTRLGLQGALPRGFPGLDTSSLPSIPLLPQIASKFPSGATVALTTGRRAGGGQGVGSGAMCLSPMKQVPILKGSSPNPEL